MKQSLTPALARVFKRLHYPFDVMLMCVRWYVAYGLSVRHLEEMLAERGIEVDHSTLHRWAIKLLPVFEKAFRRRKRPVGRSWRVDETYIKVKGMWKYLYRAVDKAGDTIDFLLRAHRDKAAAQVISKKRSIRTANLRRSPSIKAVQIWPRLRRSMPSVTSRSRSARTSI
jgi:putative transposase